MTTNYPAKQIEDLVWQHGERLRATAAVAREIAAVAAARVGAGEYVDQVGAHSGKGTRAVLPPTVIPSASSSGTPQHQHNTRAHAQRPRAYLLAIRASGQSRLV